jgi:hypothetical protein
LIRTFFMVYLFFMYFLFLLFFRSTVALPTCTRVGLLCVGFCGCMCGSAVLNKA